ncbi:MAG: M23 family metallopeptidase [Bdellovibrionaceae bacterium]|nr:M23 family metallopeptidase [Pseudobdellovibrionaceae bacterium]
MSDKNVKGSKTYTIVLFSSGTEKPKSISVSSRTLFSLGGVVITAFLISFTASVDYIQLLLEKNHAHWLRVENEYLKAQFQEIEGKLSTLESGLERVDSFSKKLRLITNTGASQDRLLELQVPTRDDVTPQPPTSSSEEAVRWPSNIGPIETSFNRQDYVGAQGVSGQAIKSEYSSIAVRLEKVSYGTEAAEQEVLQLWKDLSDKNEILQTTPSIRPTSGWVSSNFGSRLSPFSGDISQHRGLDIAADMGTPIRAPATGIVTSSTVDAGYGKVITIDHGHGIVTRYGHCSQMYVKAGQRVRRGDVIGAVGNTGRSTGPHLHYEVRLQGVPVNPERYILE